MQIRCYKCHMPFAISKENVYSALDMLTDVKLSHYDARCPRCKKTNRISRERLKHAAPGWKKEEQHVEPQE